MTSSVRGVGEVEYQNWPYKSVGYEMTNDEVSKREVSTVLSYIPLEELALTYFSPKFES